MDVKKYYEELDADLLNQIEFGSLRINQQSKTLNSEVKQGNYLLDEIDKNVKKSSGLMNIEANRAMEQRGRQDNFCWMYLVIVIECLMLFTFVSYGLS